MAGAVALAWIGLSTAAVASDAPPNDLLNAELWMQTAVEYRANCLAVYALARLRLDEALADPDWTAYGQTGNYRNLPPAVVLDLDETALDNTPYEAGLVLHGARFDPKTWDAWVRAERARAIPGAVAFTAYAASKGVKVFYVSNRDAGQKDATAHNLRALGFPSGGNVDTLLMREDRPEWSGSAKGPRFAYVARDYRVLLLFGDNFGDFTDRFSGSVSEREKTYEELKAHFGHDWMMLANPVYGSWESAPFAQDMTLPENDKRASKRGALTPWPSGP
jgi:acid phosphatase